MVHNFTSGFLAMLNRSSLVISGIQIVNVAMK
jgi:hypothetical protein